MRLSNQLVVWDSVDPESGGILAAAERNVATLEAAFLSGWYHILLLKCYIFFLDYILFLPLVSELLLLPTIGLLTSSRCIF